MKQRGERNALLFFIYPVGRVTAVTLRVGFQCKAESCEADDQITEYFKLSYI